MVLPRNNVGGIFSPLERGLLQALVCWPTTCTPFLGNEPGIPNAPHVLAKLGDPIGLPKTHVVKPGTHFSRYYDGEIPFGRVQGSYEGIYKATQRYQVKDVTVEDFGTARFNRTIKFMERVYRYQKGKCRPLPLDEVMYNPDSAIGYICKKYMANAYLLGHTRERIRTKGKLFELCPRLLEWYVQWGWRFKIPVLWETSGKAEILKQTKVDSGDIRTFTFADPFFTVAYSHLVSGIKVVTKMMANSFGFSSIRMGVTFIKGNYTDMMERLRPTITVKGDCKKWDSRFMTVLKKACDHMKQYKLGTTPYANEGQAIEHYSDQCQYSCVRMPGGHIYYLGQKKSGDPCTTDDNSDGHEFILCDHLCDASEELGVDPYSIYRQCEWNLYSDDHLNGYPDFMEEYITFPRRQAAYRRAGQELHEPPNDVIQRGPLGLSFLGATAYEKNGYYVPQYDFQRLLAILYCNDYDAAELEQVIVSIAPLVATNNKAKQVLIDYCVKYYPYLIPYVDIDNKVFSGEEAGIKMNLQNNVSSNSFRSTLSMSTNNNTNVNTRRSNTPRRPPAGGGEPILTIRNNTRGGVRATGSNPVPARKPRRNVAANKRLIPNHTMANCTTMAPMGRAFRRSFISKAHQLKHMEDVRGILAAFLNPQDHPGFVLPLGAGAVSNYNSKQAADLFGANDTTVTPTLAAGDFGRFYIQYSPVLTNASGFSNVYPNTQLVIVDGGNQPTVWPPSLTTHSANARIQYQRDPNSNVYINTAETGTADKVRPSGSSMLITFDGDNFGGGGRLASGCLPGAAFKKRVVATQSPENNIMKYEQFAAQIPGAYQGPMKKGTYMWWRPDNIEDFNFRTPQSGADSQNAVDAWTCPFVACAGFINQNSGGTGINIKNTMTVQAYTNFNLTNDNRTQPGIPILDNIEAVEDALMIMNYLPTAWPNEVHTKVINTILGGLAGLLMARTGMGALMGALAGYGVNISAIKTATAMK